MCKKLTYDFSYEESLDTSVGDIGQELMEKLDACRKALPTLPFGYKYDFSVDWEYRSETDNWHLVFTPIPRRMCNFED